MCSSNTSSIDNICFTQVNSRIVRYVLRSTFVSTHLFRCLSPVNTDVCNVCVTYELLSSPFAHVCLPYPVPLIIHSGTSPRYYNDTPYGVIYLLLPPLVNLGSVGYLQP
jgi:hypothetical protein